MPDVPSLLLEDAHDALDLDQFLARASGVRDGVTRIVARGGAAAFHVAGGFPLVLGARGATLIGQRGLRLAEPADLDVVVPLSEARDRLARMVRAGGEAARRFSIPVSRRTAPWTAGVPLAAAWEPLGAVPDDAWVATAREVASRVQEALPTDPGQPLVFAAREAVWSEPAPELGEAAIAGAAFLAHAYGFLRPGGSSRRYAAGPWQRLSSIGGTLLWRG